jgi:curli biogenesis system outer membrane secretion channel CsgG
MAVLDFQNNTGAGWWRGGTGSELSDLLTNELSATRKFKMLERKKISAVVNELKFTQSGLVDPDTRRELGKVKGARYLVTAAVSGYEENTEGGGKGVSFMGFGVGHSESKVSLSVDLRVVEVETGEIVDTRTIEATSESSSSSFSGSFMGIGGSSDSHKKTPVTKAIRGAIIRIADYLTCSMVDKTPECMAQFDQADEKRRQKTRESIKLDD